jgi:hypothetical protein
MPIVVKMKVIMSPPGRILEEPPIGLHPCDCDRLISRPKESYYRRGQSLTWLSGGSGGRPTTTSSGAPRAREARRGPLDGLAAKLAVPVTTVGFPPRRCQSLSSSKGARQRPHGSARNRKNPACTVRAEGLRKQFGARRLDSVSPLRRTRSILPSSEPFKTLMN